MRHTLTQMRYYRSQYVAVCLAIIIGVAFVAISIHTGNVLARTTQQAMASQYRGADLVVTSLQGSLPASDADAVAAADGVATVDRRPMAFGEVVAGARSHYANIAPVPEAAPIRDALDLESGRFPETSGEVVLPANVANSLDIGEGGTISVHLYVDAGASTATLTVVGILGAQSGLARGTAPDVFVWPDDVVAWVGAEWMDSLLVTIEDGVEPNVLAAVLQPLVSDGTIVRTYQQVVDDETSGLSDGTDIVAMSLLGFALVALFVAGVVITNTFSILIAQRSRVLALQRCIGATTGQVRQSVLTEAIILGIVASMIGLLAGIAISLVGVHALSLLLGNRQVATDTPFTPAVIGTPLVLGTLVTIGAAWMPSHAATRVAPLAALRPQSAVDPKIGAYGWRIVAAAVLIGAGGFLLTAGMLLSSNAPGMGPLLIGIMGGMVSFLGILVGAIVIVPAVSSFLGMLAARIGGAPAWVAASNSTRNPKRATSTAVALMIAVALITMMSVGAESSKATLAREIDARNPIDLRISNVDFYSLPGENPTALPDRVIQRIVSDDQVASTTTVIRGAVWIDDAGYSLLAIDPAAASAVVRDADQLTTLGDGQIVMPDWMANSLGTTSGETVAVPTGVNGGTVPMTVIVSDDWEDDLLITRADAERYFPGMVVTEVWARFADGTDEVDAINEIQDAFAGEERLYITGGAEDKAANYRVLDTMLLIVTGLLGIAVIIAVVGVGNTLSLSVIERTRESAILRAIGLTVTQFRWMLAIEGMILALVGAAIGLMLGIVYGFAGAFTVFSGTWGLVFEVPVGRLALIAVMAVVAGLLASVLPARAAVRVSPVSALAE